MKRLLFVFLLLLTTAAVSRGSILPGFHVIQVAEAQGFVTSIAIDSWGVIYYSVTDGRIFRISGSESYLVATVPTANEGNMALLGMNFHPDGMLITHSVLPDKTADVLSSVDPVTGQVQEIARFSCGGTCPSEHHGGNPLVAPDGTIFLGIGDLGVQSTVHRDDVPGGKLFHVTLEGAVTRFALGFRNPYDMVWDSAGDRLILADNGQSGNDEINVVTEGGDYGWPLTEGSRPPVNGTIPPIYVFPETVAPTGLWMLNGRGDTLRKGLLVTGFVSKAIQYFPDLSEPVGDPVAIVREETSQTMDVAQAPDGTIYFASIDGIFRLDVPKTGDVNGDGRVSREDLSELSSELSEGEGEVTWVAQNGTCAASWGADVNHDGVIDWADWSELSRMLSSRRRAVRRSF